MKIKFHQGQLSEPKLEALKEFMDLSYPTGRKLRTFKENIGVLGSSLSFSSSSNSFSISLKGIEKNLPQLLQQIDSLIKLPEVNEKNLKTIANIFKTDRKQEEDDAVLIAQAIAQYGLYGENSLLSNRLTVKEISNITVSEYLTLWKEVKSRAVSIHFSGKTNASDLKKLLAQNLTLNYNGTSEVPYPVNLVKRDRNEVVLIDNNKIRQSHLFFIKNTGIYTKADDSRTALFKQYFDGGFSGILTQEVREYRSLAYSSSANINYTLAKKPESYFTTYIGTQADKTNESVKLTYDLIQNMPKKPERLTDIKKNVTLKQQADFPDFRELSSVVESYLIIGYKQDPNELSAPEYKEISFNNLVSFYENKIQAQATFLGIHGDSKQFDIKELEKIGKIIKLKKEDVIRF